MPRTPLRTLPVYLLILIAVGLVAPWLLYPVLVAKLLCLAIFAMGFNLLVGQAGLLSFGHAMFFGAAAYVTAYTTKTWLWAPQVALLASVAVTALMGLIVGLLAIRRHGIYFAMMTLALAQMVYFLCFHSTLTGGDDGLSAVPRLALFGALPLSDDRVLYHLVLVCFLATFALTYRVVHSPFGQVMRAIRDNEARATSLGYAVNRYKLIAFVLSAGIAGLAGALKVLVFQIATLADVSWSISGDVIFMALIGGIGTLFGPLLGAAAMLATQSLLQGYSQWIPVLEGLIFIAAVLVLPKGLAGALQRKVNKP